MDKQEIEELKEKARTWKGVNKYIYLDAKKKLRSEGIDTIQAEDDSTSVGEAVAEKELEDVEDIPSYTQEELMAMYKKEQVELLKDYGLSSSEIKELGVESERVAKIIQLQEQRE